MGDKSTNTGHSSLSLSQAEKHSFESRLESGTEDGVYAGGPASEAARAPGDRHGEDGHSTAAAGLGGSSLSTGLTLTSSCLIYFASFGIMNSFGFFQNFYQSSYLASYSPSLIAFIGTLQVGLMYLTSPIVGAFFDAYGSKYLYPVGGLGCILSLVFLSVTSRDQIWEQFLPQGVLFGLTVAFGVGPALNVVARSFNSNRALAMGVVAAGSSAGGVCFPIMFSHLVPQIGFGWSVRVAALITAVCYAIACLITFTRPPTRCCHSEASRLKSFSDLFDYCGFRDSRYTFLALGSFVVNLGLYAPYYYTTPFVALLDPHTSIQAYLLPLINGSSLFGRVLGGYLADKIGRLNLLYPMTLIAGLLVLTMWLLAPSASQLTAFSCLYGFCSGTFISVMPAATSQILPPEKLGARLGALSSLTAVAVFIGNPIAGTLIGHSNSGVHAYTSLIVYSGTTLVGGGMLLLVARVLHARDLREKW